MNNDNYITDMVYHFERLETYKQSRELVKEIYELTKKFPPEERFFALRSSASCSHFHSI